MTTLIRTLSLRDLTLLIIGAVIGSGIFFVPAEVLEPRAAPFQYRYSCGLQADCCHCSAR